MLVIGQGRLQLGELKPAGVYAFDGVIFFKVYSFYLKRKIKKHRHKIPLSIPGIWLAWEDKIFIFIHIKRWKARYFSINETYHREHIKRRAHGNQPSGVNRQHTDARESPAVPAAKALVSIL